MNRQALLLHAIVFLLLIAGCGFSSPVADSLDDTTAVMSGDSSVLPLSQLDNLPVRLELNAIGNKQGLSRFSSKLRELAAKKRTTVTVVHIGDSHLQAALFPIPAREWLQKKFGNAGRGLVFPYRLIKTNGPEDYRFSHVGRWTGNNLLRHDTFGDPFIPGISGYVAGSTDSNACLCVHVENSQDRFNCLQVFSKNFPATVFSVGKTGMFRGVLVAKSDDLFPWLPTIALDSLCDSASITLHPAAGGRREFVTEGVVLRNGQPGVLYNAIGVNGAKVGDFLSAPLFWEQLPALQPDLFIVSLGTNDAYEPSFDQVLFRQSLDSLRCMISRTLPDCDVLVTTLNDHDCREKHYYTKTVTAKSGKKVQRTYSRTTFKHNPRIRPCNRALVQFCENNAIPYWNILEIMGGEGSIAEWVKRQAAARDHIHFTQAGYKILGTLFQKALESAIAP